MYELRLHQMHIASKKIKDISLSSLFALVLICFFFPFINVKCAGVKTTSFSGITLAKGLKINKSFINMYTKTQKFKREIKESDEIKLRASLWASVIFTLCGLVSSFLGKYLFSSIFGLAGTLMLLLFWYGVNSFIKNDGIINISFAPGFWITLFLAISSTILSLYFFRHSRIPS